MHETVVVVDTLEMMDRDEEVALELSNWINGSDRIFLLSIVILLSNEGGKGWLEEAFVFYGEASLGGTLQPVLEHEF